jgi:hypothetical protein
MKKYLSIVLVSSLMAPALFAKGNHPMAGCGLAYILFSKDDNSKGIQILAATTNNIYGTQTFAITSGTSGCTESGVVAKSKEVGVFAEVNLENLRLDISKGDGAYGRALALLLGVKAEAAPDMVKLLQSNYTVLFPSADTTYDEFLQNVSKTLAAHPELLS